MHALSAPVMAAAGLLALAGVLKLRRPGGTAQALRTQGLPSGPALVRALGAAEVAVAALALLGVTAGTALLALAYTGFTAFVALALVRGRPLSSCGCFAEPDLPPTAAHVAVTAVLAIASAVAAAAGARSGLPALTDAPLPTALGVAGAATLVGWLSYLVLAQLPRLQAAVRAAAGRPDQADGPQLFALVPVRSARP